MKKYNGFIIIAVSIVIAAIIISIPIYNKSISSLDHCYKKVYKHRLKIELEKVVPNGSFTKEFAEAEAARSARFRCLKEKRPIIITK